MKLVFILCIVFSGRAFGWGDTGHRIVGKLAENYLTEKAKKNLSSIMGRESLARAATWPDEIRSWPDDTYAYAIPWHYVDVPDGKTYSETEKSPKGDIIHGIGVQEKKLKNSEASAKEKKEAVRFLVHFVGDIHQPLHVGNGTDRGGNWCMVKWFGKVANLHEVWDEKVIDQVGLSYSEYAEDLLNRIRSEYTEKEINSIQSADVLQWASESQELRDQTYPNADREYCGKNVRKSKVVFPNIEYTYQFIARPIVEKRLMQAGLRLAARLNRLFDH